MIVIQSQAEIRMIETLEALKGAAGVRRCLWLKTSGISEMTKPLMMTIVSEVKRLIPAEDCQLYFLFNRDLAIIGNGLSVEQRQILHDALSRIMEMPLAEDLVTLYPLDVKWNHVAVAVEGILEQKRALAAKQQKQAEVKKRERVSSLTFDPELIDKMKRLRKSRNGLEVMVVEDDAFSRNMVCKLLRKKYTVSTVGDGKSTFSTYVLKAPNVLFLDIELPDANGLDILKKLLEIDEDAYIVMLSGNGNKDNIMHAMKLGAKGFIGKPFNKDKLLQYIDMSIESS